MKKQNRISKEEYLMNIAMLVGARSTCPDMAVGCVIATSDGHIISTGYNGVPSGDIHCLTVDNKCLENGPNHRVIHSEINAICQAAKLGIKLEKTIAYITHAPCIKCRGALKQAGIKKIIIKK